MPENPSQETHPSARSGKGKRMRVWATLTILAVALVVAGGAATGYMVHLSNTNPQFCQTCHVMEPNVTSYLTSNNLDHIHYTASVQCKECHDYSLGAEISSGISYVTGNYEVDETGVLLPVKYGDELCLKCHISFDHIAEETSYLDKNPHRGHTGELPCSTCHVAHGEQIDYCVQCHDHGEQEMFGADTETSAP